MSSLGEVRHFCPNMCMKNLQNARILHGICPKNIFCPNFEGARAPSAPRLLRLWTRRSARLSGESN